MFLPNHRLQSYHSIHFYEDVRSHFLYDVLDGKLILRNDNTPSVIRRIFKEYLQGKGFDKIARGLYNDGCPNPAQIAGKANSKDKWHGSSIRGILTNPHYTGDLVQGRQTTRSVTSKARENISEKKYISVEGTHEALVCKEDFNAVQALIESRKRKQPYAEKHLFTNTLSCADCGKGMHYKKNRRGYVCGSYNKHGSKACSDHHVIEEKLASAILDDINKLLVNVNQHNLFSKLDMKMKKEFDQLNKQLKSINRQIDDHGIQKTKLIKLLANEVITQQDYRDVVEQNEINLKHLFQKRSEIEIKLSNKDTNEQIKKIQKELSLIKKVDILTSDLLHRLIERIEIKADGSARIYYRFSLPSAII
ncbi:recombinase family protein [Neobacillus niacini]|uniref:recombinase family protein n=1 Tax=Neobacillus niacini TaxID=86668 RepID=UPI002FFEE741